MFENREPVLKYFEEISQIPRGSENEEGIADYIVSFAIKRDLSYKRDAMGNVVIYKPASHGLEHHSSVMLQAHMDMVCEKDPESNHNFLTDPIEFIEKDGWLYANKTTLGADDGLGVATMLALLDSSFSHPDLVCVFTVQEETGLYGAKGINPEWLKANRMISLDGEMFGETIVSSCGGRDVIVKRKLHKKRNELPVYQIEVSGLLGGHSGDEINKERGNASILIGRILKRLVDEGIRYSITDISGGKKANAITRNAYVSIATESYIADFMLEIENDLRKEYQNSDPDLRIAMKQIESSYSYTREETWDIVNMLFLAPHGVLSYSTAIEHLPVMSLNLGIMEISDDVLSMTFSTRAVLKSQRDYMASYLRTLAMVWNFNCFEEGDFDGWDYNIQSPLRKILKKEFKAVYDENIIESATHGGLETGIFKGYNPALDIITLGATAVAIHTSHEHLDIDSLVELYHFLKHFLGKL